MNIYLYTNYCPKYNLGINYSIFIYFNIDIVKFK